jgi:quercetin dioxygenase-like cupin family protein
MQRIPCGTKPSRRAQAEWFTGTVWIDPIAEVAPPQRVTAAIVRFSPGARTNWHTHPLGQTLHVLSGSGLAQSWGGAVVALCAGDTISIPPGEKHWHGAGPNNAMTHLAIQEALDGKSADWLEAVTDEQYSA